jgi:hypothetical protein
VSHSWSQLSSQSPDQSLRQSVTQPANQEITEISHFINQSLRQVLRFVSHSRCSQSVIWPAFLPTSHEFGYPVSCRISHWTLGVWPCLQPVIVSVRKLVTELGSHSSSWPVTQTFTESLEMLCIPFGLQYASAGVLLSLHCYPENGSEMFLRNIGFSSN